MYVSVLLYGCGEGCVVEGGHVTEAFELDEVHIGEGFAYLPYGEAVVELSLHYL